VRDRVTHPLQHGLINGPVRIGVQDASYPAHGNRDEAWTVSDRMDASLGLSVGAATA
jgi:hypothetical protein